MKTKKQLNLVSRYKDFKSRLTVTSALKFDLLFMKCIAIFFANLSLMCAFEILDLRDQISAIVGGAL